MLEVANNKLCMHTIQSESQETLCINITFFRLNMLLQIKQLHGDTTV